MRCRLILTFTILIFACVVFTACDRGEPEQTPAPTPTMEPGATGTPAPVETRDPTEAPEQVPTTTPGTVETPPPFENRYVFDNGVLGTKFSVLQPIWLSFLSHNSNVHRLRKKSTI